MQDVHQLAWPISQNTVVYIYALLSRRQTDIHIFKLNMSIISLALITPLMISWKKKWNSIVTNKDGSLDGFSAFLTCLCVHVNYTPYCSAKWDLLGEAFKAYKWLMNTFDADKKTCMLIYKCIIIRARILKSSLSVCLSACVTVVFFSIYESTIIVMYDLIKTVNIFQYGSSRAQDNVY